MKIKYSHKKNIPSKYQVLKHFVDTADQNCICMYYKDSYFKNIPNIVREKYIRELASEGYLKPMLRHVILTADAYTYKRIQRNKFFTKCLTILGKPISYLFVWVLGIFSELLIEYLIRIILP